MENKLSARKKAFILNDRETADPIWCTTDAGWWEMAQFDFAENSNIQFAQKEEIEGIKEIEQIQLDNTVIESTAVMTGDRDRSRFLYYQLKICFN